MDKISIIQKALCLLSISAMLSCTSKKSETKLFEEQLPDDTGVAFANTVTQGDDNNVVNYPYFFNGGGVAIGDINNDDLPDLYFTGNQVSNKLYLNKGNFKFEDITDKAGLAVVQGWKTGVTMADVNQDGWLDIYVSRSAMADSTLRKNLLFINNGDLTFTEKAGEYGIADNSYSTQAAFFDYDKDNDLDLFVLNHSLPQYGGFNRLLVDLKKKKGKKFGSKLYQNNNGEFTDVSEQAGLINNVLSFGLGVAISDLNQDGWPDLYISNDFNEEDYLYYNNHDGTFTNAIKTATGHVSLFSMGSDIADINNDALTDIFTLDMQPESNERIKLSSGDDNYDKYQMLVNAGFHHQSMRNMLQLNNGDETFSEIGQLAGVSNTDWSWSALFADFDGDGYKDLFVSNGYEKDYTNMQFLKFTVDEQLKARETGTQPNMKLILDKMPSINEGNFIFSNNGDLTFTKRTDDWGISRKYKSNGAAYADLDNDGDLDLVINTMNEPAVIYKNNSEPVKHFIKVDLRKSNPKQIIEGTKMYAYAGGKMQYYEYSSVRGFQSCMNVPMVIGINDKLQADSIRVIWPDGKTAISKNVAAEKIFAPKYADASLVYSYQKKSNTLFKEEKIIDWKHTPTAVNDFKRQFLLPRMYSNSGPKMAKGDVNNDGLEDVFICAPSQQTSALFLQQRNGAFVNSKQSDFDKDKACQDEDAIFIDVDGDKDLDLYVVSGGYLFEENNSMLQDRIYFNDGKGNFKRNLNAVPTETFAGSCVTSLDVDGDHDLDLFVGSRMVPGKYPVTPKSIFLINDGKGTFKENIDEVAPGLSAVGMVCDAKSADINQDGKTDLIVAGEWMNVKVFINESGKLTDQSAKWFSTSTLGWWNSIVSDDFDNDGDFDFVIGNYGSNNQFKVDAKHPATLAFKDFNNDGQVDPFFCYYIGDKSFPYASRDEALGQVTSLRPRFVDYTSYSNATLEIIFNKEEMKDVNVLSADMLKTVYLENKGNKFEMHALPSQAQFSPVYAIAVMDLDKDGDKDLILGGNESNVRVRLGKSDANHGMILTNDGKGNFTYVSQLKSGLNVNGDIRSLVVLNNQVVVGLNNGNISSLHYK
jgi:hypothetical protein